MGRLAFRIGSHPDPVYCRVAGSDLLVWTGIFQDDEYQALRRWKLPADGTVLDLGGNIGAATLFFSQFIPNMRAIVVEPDAENCQMVELNCRGLIAEGRVRTVQAFVAGEAGIAGIDRSGRSWAFKKVSNSSAAGPLIPCVTMSMLIEAAGFDHVDLLKCDVEGTEAEIFAKCGQWIHRVKHLIVETHAPYWPKDLYRDLQNAGWDFEITNEKYSPTIAIVGLRGK